MNKYKNKILRYNGIKFHSKKEFDRYILLKYYEEQGIIKSLELQKKFILIPKNDKLREVSYYADFVYYRDNKLVVEDVKGYRTKDYKIKRKLMYHFHNILINEI